MRLFEAKDLTKKYDKTVLNHLDFSIDASMLKSR